SANRRKSSARLARIHAQIANVRADALHKATSMLAVRYETVVAEDLNVAGMTRNRKLARAISDQGFGTGRWMLGYKTLRGGGRRTRNPAPRTRARPGPPPGNRRLRDQSSLSDPQRTPLPFSY